MFRVADSRRRRKFAAMFLRSRPRRGGNDSKSGWFTILSILLGFDSIPVSMDDVVKTEGQFGECSLKSWRLIDGIEAVLGDVFFVEFL